MKLTYAEYMKGKETMDFLTYKGYQGAVKYSKEDNIFYGEVLGLDHAFISYEGTSLNELEKDFHDDVNHYLENCLADGTQPEKPSNKVPDSIEELFKNWHGKYEVSDEMKEWDEMKPEGRELL